MGWWSIVLLIAVVACIGFGLWKTARPDPGLRAVDPNEPPPHPLPPVHEDPPVAKPRSHHHAEGDYVDPPHHKK